MRHEREGADCDSGRSQEGFRDRTRRETRGAEKKGQIWHPLVKLSVMDDLRRAPCPACRDIFHVPIDPEISPRARRDYGWQIIDRCRSNLRCYSVCVRRFVCIFPHTSLPELSLPERSVHWCRCRLLDIRIRILCDNDYNRLRDLV